MLFGSPSMVVGGLACLLFFILDPVASQGPCESDNLIVIGSTGATPVPSLQQPLCFGCFFLDPQAGSSFFAPLGTEWSVTVNSITTPLTNKTGEGVTLSGTNGTLLLESPSSFLQYESSQLRCAYDDLSYIATLTEAVLNPPYILDVNAAGEIIGTEGETVTLSCTNDDNTNLNEQFMWMDSKGEALDVPGIVRPHDLVLDDITRSQSGVYVCVVSAGGVSLSVNTTLIVQYPALILSGPSASPSSILQTGSNLILSCMFEGVPAPSVTWTVNGSNVDVDGNDRLSIQTNDVSTQLSFTPIMGGDNGLYVCGVDNSIGSPSVSTAISVTVKIPDEPTPTPDEPTPDEPTVMNLAVMDMSTKLVFLEWSLGLNVILASAVLCMNMW